MSRRGEEKFHLTYFEVTCNAFQAAKQINQSETKQVRSWSSPKLMVRAVPRVPRARDRRHGFGRPCPPRRQEASWPPGGAAGDAGPPRGVGGAAAAAGDVEEVVSGRVDHLPRGAEEERRGIKKKATNTRRHQKARGWLKTHVAVAVEGVVVQVPGVVEAARRTVDADNVGVAEGTAAGTDLPRARVVDPQRVAGHDGDPRADEEPRRVPAQRRVRRVRHAGDKTRHSGDGQDESRM